MKTVRLRMPESLDQELSELARRTGQSKSLVIRMALSEFLPRRSRHSRRSFLSRASDLAGSVVGSHDLSTNRRWLEGYGR